MHEKPFLTLSCITFFLNFRLTSSKKCLEAQTFDFLKIYMVFQSNFLLFLKFRSILKFSFSQQKSGLICNPNAHPTNNFCPGFFARIVAKIQGITKNRIACFVMPKIAPKHAFLSIFWPFLLPTRRNYICEGE